jgi:hypothetical protein
MPSHHVRKYNISRDIMASAAGVFTMMAHRPLAPSTFLYRKGK